MRLYWKQADCIDPDPVLTQLPPDRAARILRCRTAAERQRLAAAGLLLAECFGPEAVKTIARTAEGKPYLPNGPHFSLSHSGSLAVLLTSDLPCGVDVEPVSRTLPPRMQEKLLLPEELAARRAFAWFWTRKEAVMKLTGFGLGLPSRAFSVLPSEISLSGRRIRLGTQLVCGHFISWAVEISS